MGEANCGVPLIFADNTIKGFLRVSPSALRVNNLKNVYALKAVGDSMNATDIKGRNIESGDYVLVENAGAIEHGEVVVSVIDGAANIKRLFIDAANHRLILLSESKEPLSPIVIDESDFDSHYHAAGKVVDVIKAIPSFEGSIAPSGA
jgi:SOS-response transcriptional repressor LexA